MIKHRVSYSAKNYQFAISFFGDRTLRFLFESNFPKTFCFWCHERLKLRIVNGAESNGLDLFLLIREIVEQGFGHLFITLNSSHFF